MSGSVSGHAPCKTTYQWGYLLEALEADGAHRAELLFTPSIHQGVHGVFLKQKAESDPDSLHVLVMDEARVHMKQEDGRIPANIRVLSLPPYCPELNPAEWLDLVVKHHQGTGFMEVLQNRKITSSHWPRAGASLPK